MSEEEDRFLRRICSRCNVGLYYPHPELYEWVKCETCGFCIKHDKL